MTDLGWPELLIVAAIAMLLFGTKKMPDMARSLGRSMRIVKAELGGLHDEPEPAATARTPATPPRPRSRSRPPTGPSRPIRRRPAEPLARRPAGARTPPGQSGGGVSSVRRQWLPKGSRKPASIP